MFTVFFSLRTSGHLLIVPTEGVEFEGGKMWQMENRSVLLWYICNIDNFPHIDQSLGNEQHREYGL